MEEPAPKPESIDYATADRRHRRVGRNGFWGAVAGIAVVLLGAGAMTFTLWAGGLLILFVEPAVIGVIGIIIAVAVARTRTLPGFAPGFLVGFGVSLLLLCGTCFAFFNSFKL